MALSLVKNAKFRGLLKITRSYNLLMILLTQYLVYIFLMKDGDYDLSYILSPSFFLLSLSTILVAAAGYIINDYHDVKIDMINKPSRVVVGSIIRRRIVLILYISLSILGVALGFLLSWKIGALNIFAACWLWMYSIRFKKIAFWGNFSIGLLTALSILILYVWKPVDGNIALLAFAWFAFIITLIREVIKDMEDVRGDKAHGCKTLPIIWGIPGTIRFLFFLNGVMIISLIAAFFYSNNLILNAFAILVIAQIVWLTYYLRFTDTIKGFRRLGKFCKIIMLTGIVAMFFF